ncbi:Xaa-Pro peptidase family protein [Corynebacterium sp. UMB9976]|uniref:M24 family metallopeptidase n=1 Tax=unclassified Corynebacterium TaxID=2624378 RepID=UPI00254C2F9A|nr:MULTISPECIES: Xaa-Pro peptidase family protein [unclassified Corynebacterium]MDK6301116.1 Xaa-Pro peptidase family protein [Corynebacterium sp. UMB9976]MDK7134218.1 Xaa-Pro peptidase family protein [Corynebacterium sp. UMB4614]
MTQTQRYAERRNKLAARLQERDLPGLLVTDLKNVRYLTGFSGSNAVYLQRPDGRGVLGTDGRYATQVEIETGQPEDVELLIDNKLLEQVPERAQVTGFAVESSLSIGEAKKLAADGPLPEVAVGIVEELRLVKDSAEIAALEAAGELADSVWQEFLDEGGIREGRTEIEAAADLEYRLRKAGAEALSFDTILASGVNATKPHAGVSRDPIVPGLVTVDFGIYLDGYASDQTRTVCVGEPDELSATLYDVVLRSQRAGAAAVAPGTALFDIDKTCRDIITDAGYGEYFVHSTGHGVGLDVHEAPSANSRVDRSVTLAEGMTLTVEPGIYIPGKTGLRIENTYVVTADGAKSCNASSTDLRIV